MSLSQGYATRACTEIEELIVRLEEEGLSDYEIVKAVLMACFEIKRAAEAGYY